MVAIELREEYDACAPLVALAQGAHGRAQLALVVVDVGRLERVVRNHPAERVTVPLDDLRPRERVADEELLADSAVDGDERLAESQVVVEGRVENEGVVGWYADDVAGLADARPGKHDELVAPSLISVSRWNQLLYLPSEAGGPHCPGASAAQGGRSNELRA